MDPPRDTACYLRYFCAAESGHAEQLKENEGKRVALYKLAAAFLRAYANLANEIREAGYSEREVRHAIRSVLHDDEGLVDALFEIVRSQRDY